MRKNKHQYIYNEGDDMLPDDEDVHAGDVDGQTPPVHEARDVDAGEENTPGHFNVHHHHQQLYHHHH